MSKIATSTEQSKRLLDAGIDPKSADMRWEQFLWLVPHLCYQPNPMPLIAPKVTPAWSLSALWQMVYELDKTYEFPTELSADELMETLVSTVVYRRTH